MIKQIKFEFMARSKYNFDDVELTYFKIKDFLKSIKINLWGDLSSFSRKESCDYYNIEIWCTNNLNKDADYYKALKLDLLSIIIKNLPIPQDSEIRFFEK